MFWQRLPIFTFEFDDAVFVAVWSIVFSIQICNEFIYF